MAIEAVEEPVEEVFDELEVDEMEEKTVPLAGQIDGMSGLFIISAIINSSGPNSLPLCLKKRQFFQFSYKLGSYLYNFLYLFFGLLARQIKKLCPIQCETRLID